MTRDSWIYRPANANGDGTIRRQLHKTDISKLGGWSADGTGTSQNKATEWTVDEPRPYPTRNEDVEYAPISITTILLVSFIVILLVVMLLTYWRIVIRRQLNNHHSTTGGAASGTPADSKRQTARIRREKILSYFERSKDEMILNRNNLPAATSNTFDIESPAPHDDDDAVATEMENAAMGGDTSDMASAREEAPNDKCTTDDTTKQPQAHRLKLTDTACAICMEEYMVDDLVVYASAATAGGCPHMFHKDCFVDYLVAYRGDDGYGSPCPTCRQPFCSPTMFHDGNKEGDSKKPYAPRRSSGPAGEVSRRDASSRQSDGVPDATESTLSDSVVSLSASVADGESQQASSSHNAGDV